VRNPLARIVGKALRHLRQLPPEVDVAALARSLDINENTYRRIEAGTDPMHPAYALRYSEALVHTKVSWSRLSLVLVAVQTLHSERDNPKDMLSVLQRLTIHAPTLRRALDGAAELAELELKLDELEAHGGARYAGRMGGADGERQKVQREIEERRSDLGERLAQFLTSAEEPSVTSSDPVQAAALSLIADAIEGVNPVYLDVVADQLLRLGAFPPLVTPAGLLQWESFNAPRFRRVFAVTRNPGLLLRSAADRVVDWSYVWRSSFEGMYILVIDDSTGAADSFRRELYEVLIARTAGQRPAGKEAAIISQLEKRVRVKVQEKSPLSIGPHQRRGVRRPAGESLIPAFRLDQSEDIENAWFFHIRQPNYVLAYVDNATESRSPDQTTIQVLAWRDALVELRALEAAWQDELDGRPGVLVESA
jgi:hypothetical protein